LADPEIANAIAGINTRHSKLNKIICPLVDSTSRYPDINVINSKAHHSSQMRPRDQKPSFM
jgi:hypothetical protein